MRERVSRQRRETALQAVKRLRDPDYRERHGLSGSDVPVLVVLWNDSVADVLTKVRDEGGRAVVCIRRPDGVFGTLVIADQAVQAPAGGEEQLTAAPQSTVGMLIDSFGREDGTFVLEIADSPLGQFHLELVAS